DQAGRMISGYVFVMVLGFSRSMAIPSRDWKFTAGVPRRKSTRRLGEAFRQRNGWRRVLWGVARAKARAAVVFGGGLNARFAGTKEAGELGASDGGGGGYDWRRARFV